MCQIADCEFTGVAAICRALSCSAARFPSLVLLDVADSDGDIVPWFAYGRGQYGHHFGPALPAVL